MNDFVPLPSVDAEIASFMQDRVAEGLPGGLSQEELDNIFYLKTEKGH